jgi:hypothetical protein
MTALVSHLKLLEAESIHIFREAAAQFRAPVLLYSIGKDSTVLLHLARKAFFHAPVAGNEALGEMLSHSLFVKLRQSRVSFIDRLFRPGVMRAPPLIERRGTQSGFKRFKRLFLILSRKIIFFCYLHFLKPLKYVIIQYSITRTLVLIKNIT